MNLKNKEKLEYVSIGALFKTVILLIAMLLSACVLYAQPVYRFTVKIGIDKETADSLGSYGEVSKRVVKMFQTINAAFNNEALGITGYYDFVPDMDSLYIYEGSSGVERKPHPHHDYLVIMDGFRNFPDEGHGGWFGSHHQTIGHDRGHVPGKISDPFDEQATDGIIHEFGHARGLIDLYAAAVDPSRNPINGMRFQPVTCIMNYPYGVRHWSKYAVNILNLTKDKIVNVDEVIANLLPQKINIVVKDWHDKSVSGADVRVYPVVWYSYSVGSEPVWTGKTSDDGIYTFPDIPFIRQRAYGFKYCNLLVEVAYGDRKSYGWMPLYLVQNAFFDGKESFELEIILKEGHTLFEDDLSVRVKK